jgi:hypothetical protein
VASNGGSGFRRTSGTICLVVARDHLSIVAWIASIRRPHTLFVVVIPSSRLSALFEKLPGQRIARPLEDFYYAGFDLDANDIPPSRHSFMHGVGPDAEAAKPAFCMRLLLTLDQLFFYV